MLSFTYYVTCNLLIRASVPQTPNYFKTDEKVRYTRHLLWKWLNSSKVKREFTLKRFCVGYVDSNVKLFKVITFQRLLISQRGTLKYLWHHIQNHVITSLWNNWKLSTLLRISHLTFGKILLLQPSQILNVK